MNDERLLHFGARRIPYVEVAPAAPRAAALFCHGIFSEKNEDGRFVRLAQRLAEHDIATWRFDYVGHGSHPVASEHFTVSAAMDDYLAVQSAFQSRFERCSSIFSVSSSFGGSLTLLLAQAKKLGPYESLVLLNPVVEYPDTLVDPHGQQLAAILTPGIRNTIWNEGIASLESGFVVSRRLFLELSVMTPAKGFEMLDAPTLIIHGTSDAAVDCESVRAISAPYSNVEFEEIKGGTHAFAPSSQEERSFDLTVNHIEKSIYR